MKPLPEFVAAGEALTDLITVGPGQWTSNVGGSTWNVARAMASLGVSSAFAGAISQDVFGDALARANDDAGLDARFLQRVAKPPLLAIVHELDPPAYFFVGSDSADLHFDPALLPAHWSTSARWVHFGGISLAREPLAGRLVGMARLLKHSGVRISYDPNFRQCMDSGYDLTLRTMTGLADVIKVSDEDLAGLFRTSDLDAAFARLKAFNPSAMYLRTHGADGATLWDRDRHWFARPPAVRVVDTVGAGDATIAAFLFSLMRHVNEAPPSHLAFAMAAGAAACAGPGASPPSLASVMAYKSGGS